MVFAFAACATPPTTSDEEFTSEGPLVRRVVIEGARHIDPDRVRDAIVTTQPPFLELRFWRADPRLDSFTLEDDLERIRDLYHAEGYFAVEVDAEVVPADERQEEASVDVVIAIREGERTFVEAWTVEFLDSDDATSPDRLRDREVLRASIEPVAGDPFGTRLYRDQRAKLLEAAAELGFPFARIEGGARLDSTTHLATIRWQLQLGPRAIIGRIEVTGTDGVHPDVIRRELRFERGAVLRPSQVRETERRLVATGLFSSVVVGRPSNASEFEAEAEPEGEAESPSPEDSPGDADETTQVDLEVRVTESPPRSVRASIGYGTEDGPRAEVSFDWRNFLGDARRLRLRAFGSFLDVGFDGSLGQPYLFTPRARGDLAVSALRQSRPGYEAFVTGASGLVTLYPDREGPLSLTLGLGYEFADILSFETEADTALRGPEDSVLVNTYTILRYDDTDDAVDPGRGFRAALSVELGGTPIGSDLDFHAWDLDLRTYRRFGRFTFAARAAAATFDPIDGTRADVPLTRRLYSGGTESIRGFGFQRLGPEDASNDPVGGLSRLETSVEVRIRTWRELSLVGFVDAGDVRSRPFDFRPSQLRAAAGPGIRYDTPVGPIRLDAGFLLNAPPDVDPWRIHLSVGHAF